MATRPDEVNLVRECRQALVWPAFRQNENTATASEHELRQSWPLASANIRYHIAAHPERFMLACDDMAATLAGTGKRRIAAVNARFSFVPSCSKQVPRFVRLDEQAVRAMFRLQFREEFGDHNYCVNADRHTRGSPAKILYDQQKHQHEDNLTHLRAHGGTASDEQDEMNEHAMVMDAWVTFDSLRCFSTLFNSEEIGERWERFAYTFETNGVAAHLQWRRVPRRRAVAAVTRAAADAYARNVVEAATASAAPNGSMRSQRRHELKWRRRHARARSPLPALGPMSEGCRAQLDAQLATHGLVSLELHPAPATPGAPSGPAGPTPGISGIFAVIAQQLKLVGAGHPHTPSPPPPTPPSPLLRPTPTLHASTLPLPRPRNPTTPCPTLATRVYSYLPPATSTSKPALSTITYIGRGLRHARRRLRRAHRERAGAAQGGGTPLAAALPDQQALLPR